MEVAKYIAQFLLKNNFVYVHGLGNLELKRKPSRHDGEVLLPPSYEVIMTPMGSIDDNLANYIATNEQISISKASNALREFSMQARADMHKGQSVEIPGIGKFSEERGRTIFTTDPNFLHKAPPIPTVKYAKRVAEPEPLIPQQPIPDYTYGVTPETTTAHNSKDYSGSGISWVKVGLLVVAVAALGAAAYLGIRYMNRNNATHEMPLIVAPDSLKTDSLSVVTDTVANPQSNIGMDSTDVVNSNAVVSKEGLLSFDVLINTYDNLAKAQRRTDRLKSYGNNVVLQIAEDSTEFYVIMPITNLAAADTAKLLDSLSRNFNPNGVSIWR